VAFEVALRMKMTDRPLASLTMVDSRAPNGADAPCGHYDDCDVILELVKSLELRAKSSLDLDRAMLESRDAAERLRVLHGRMVGAGLMPSRSHPNELRGMLRNFGAALRTNYHPQQLYTDPLRLVLVPDPGTSRLNSCQHMDRLSGWRRYAPNLIGWLGSGDHMSVLEPPHVHALALWWRGT
jgi:thioesterase domain-containing protein